MEENIMCTIRYAEEKDRDFWFSLDKHLAECEFDRKVRDKMAYVLTEDDRPVGLLRYHLFWDNTPFCTLLFVENSCQKRGYGRQLMEHWEAEMREAGYGMVMVSTVVDEDAQHFYRKLGYKDCGCLILDISGYEQPMEMFMAKALEKRTLENV